MNRCLFALENEPPKNYAWGSRDALAKLRGAPYPTAEPEAELWMGAHPLSPSRIERDGKRSLLELGRDDPEFLLGASHGASPGETFPFLLKLLAARLPLSLQAHPNLDQARRGFARENAAGIPLDSPSRNYKDENHKPELIAALEPFSALVGFRERAATLRLFERLDAAYRETAGAPASPFAPLLDALRLASDAESIPRFLRLSLDAAAPRRSELAGAVLAACRLLAARGGEFASELAWGVRLGEQYPGDPGIAVALALNLVVLEPGEALYLPAGNLHSYLEGTGVEIMASSDNVLRGGLTPKHVDVDELLAILDPRSGPVERVRVETRGPERLYLTPAREFALSRFELDAEAARVGPVRGPEIVVVTRGSATLRRGSESLHLASGQSAFVPPAGGDYGVEGTASVFRARASTA